MGRFFKWFGLPGNLVLTLLMSLLSIVLACVYRTPSRFLCMGAMLCSSLGDIILMNYKPITNKLPFRGFTAGALAFALAHCIYTAAFVININIAEYKFINIGFYLGIALFVLSVFALLYLNSRNKNPKSSLLALGLFYLLMICINCTVIMSYGFSKMGLGLCAAVGAISFFISDFFIALEKIGGFQIKNADTIIWWFYPIGQILILIGA